METTPSQESEDETITPRGGRCCLEARTTLCQVLHTTPNLSYTLYPTIPHPLSLISNISQSSPWRICVEINVSYNVHLIFLFGCVYSKRDDLEDQLRRVTMERGSIRKSMVWCLDHADSAEEVSWKMNHLVVMATQSVV